MDDLGTSDEDAGARSEDTAAAQHSFGGIVAGSSEPTRWGRVVGGLVVAVLGVLPLLAGIALFIFALTVDEVCMYECNPVSAEGRLFTGFVGGVLVAVGLALLAGAYRLLFRKPPPPD